MACGVSAAIRPLEHGFGHFEGFLAGNVDYKAFLDSPDRPLFWKYNARKAVRYGDFKYVETVIGKGYQKQKVRFLFNLEKDVEEKSDIMDSNPETAAEMREMLYDWMEDVSSEIPNQTK